MTPALQDRVGSANVEITLTEVEADHALRVVLAEAPSLLGLQEWRWGKPSASVLDTRKANLRLKRATAGTRYEWGRPHGGGGPLVWDGHRYGLESLYGVVLAKGGFVGRLSGRKSTLPESIATVGIFHDDITSETAGMVDIHFTAEVQRGAHYRLDPAHWPRVLRHKRERAALRRLVKRLLRKVDRLYVVGDTNYDGMPCPPLVSAWDGHRGAEAAGTLGSRTPDQVYAQDRSSHIKRVPTKSDHDAVVATYKRSV